MLKGKRIVVTGGCGFIGSHIVETLWQDNDVVVLDNLSSGKMDNISSFDVKFHKVDLTESISSYITGADYVFHTAANISIEKSYNNPRFDLMNNAQGTLNLLETCQKQSVRNLVYSSSSAVYSNHCTQDIKETDELAPENHYGISKLMAEYYVRLYSRLAKLNTVCLRYFNVYGPRQSIESLYSGVVTIFMDRKLNREEFVVFGDGNQTRDFIFVSDVVKANLLAALKIEEISGEVFNVGTGQETSIKDLANWFKPSKITFKEKRDFDVVYNSANISKTQKQLGFTPEVELHEGLQMYWDYMYNMTSKKLLL